jgi:hypothetical protein
MAARPAFDDANKARLVDKVLHEAPVRPGKVDAGVPRDLETIVLKCLNKDPHDRYVAAEALAEDLRRFLADRPIRASDGKEKGYRDLTGATVTSGTIPLFQPGDALNAVQTDQDAQRWRAAEDFLFARGPVYLLAIPCSPCWLGHAAHHACTSTTHCDRGTLLFVGNTHAINVLGDDAVLAT